MLKNSLYRRFQIKKEREISLSNLAIYSCAALKSHLVKLHALRKIIIIIWIKLNKTCQNWKKTNPKPWHQHKTRILPIPFMTAFLLCFVLTFYYFPNTEEYCFSKLFMSLLPLPLFPLLLLRAVSHFCSKVHSSTAP